MQEVHMYTVMVASPSDIPELRKATQEALYSWNDSHSIDRNIVLLPLLWESNSVPMMGGHPQEILNSQLVEKADIVVALFGSRMGQQTPQGLSGTAVEMQTAHTAGKPVHPYFSKEAIPYDVEVEQLQKLRDFKKGLSGLYKEFSNQEELKFMIWQAIDHDLKVLEEEFNSSSAPQESSAQVKGVDFLVQPKDESYTKTDRRGNITNKTRRWVEITNQGDVDAHEVLVEPVEGQNFFVLDSGPFTIHRGQTRKINVLYTAATKRAGLVISWVENNEKKSFTYEIK